MWERICDFFEKKWTTRDKVMITLIAFLTGIVVGMKLAPARSVEFGNNYTGIGEPLPPELGEAPEENAEAENETN